MTATVLVWSDLLGLQFSVVFEGWVSTCGECESTVIRVDGHVVRAAPSAQSTSPAITISRSPNLRETMLQNRPLGSEAFEVHASSKQCLRS